MVSRVSRWSSAALIGALFVASCEQADEPYVAEWPGGPTVASAESVGALFRTYFGYTPTALVGCGPRRVGISIMNAPGDVRNLTTRRGDTTVMAHPAIGRVQASVAEAAALLAWSALEESQVVDTVSIQLATPDRRTRFHFVPARDDSYLHPLRLLDRGEAGPCAGLT